MNRELLSEFREKLIKEENIRKEKANIRKEKANKIREEREKLLLKQIQLLKEREKRNEEEVENDKID